MAVAVTVQVRPSGSSPPEDPLGRSAAQLIDQLMPELEIELEYCDPTGGAGGPMQASGLGPTWSMSATLTTPWIRTLLVKPSTAASILYDIATLQTLPPELQDVLPAIETAVVQLAGQGTLPGGSPRFIGAAMQELVAAVLTSRLLSMNQGASTPAAQVQAVVTDVLIHLERLSATRVEGHSLSHGVLIAAASAVTSRLAGAYPEVLDDLDRVPLVFDGSESLLWIDLDARPVDEINERNIASHGQSSWPPGTNNLPVYRSQLGDAGIAAAASNAFKGLSFYLRPDGTIWAFSDGVPLLFNRSGRWRGLAFSSFLGSLSKLARGASAARLVLDAALQLSMSGHGGILGVIEDPNQLAAVRSEDRYDQAAGSVSRSRGKGAIHALLNAQPLDARTLARLAAIDGATIISSASDLLAYGAIVSSPQGGGQGSREAAAAYLSYECDVVLKVSEDGPISVFLDGNKTGAILAR